MFKVAFFLWRRADYDRNRFIDYYENKHAVLSYRIVPQPQDFRRNYPIWDQEAVTAGRPSVFGLAPFDVMTELFHNDRSGFQAQLSTVTKSPAKELMEQDELNFLNRNQQVLLIFDEQGGTGAASPARAGAKIVRYIRRSPSIPFADFRAVYEKEGVAAIAGSLEGIVEYRRSYPLFDDPMSYAGNWHTQGRPDNETYPLDLVEEFWVADPTQIQGIRQMLCKPQRLIDDAGTHAVLVDEYRSDLGTRMAPVVNKSVPH